MGDKDACLLTEQALEERKTAKAQFRSCSAQVRHFTDTACQLEIMKVMVTSLVARRNSMEGTER